MENLRKFINPSITFNSFVFNGNYEMDTELFISFYSYFKDTGINLLDDYSEYIYFSWLNDYDYISDMDYLNKVDLSLSKLRKSKIICSDKLSDSRYKLRIIRRTYYNYEEKKRNRPRVVASTHTSNPKVREAVFKKYGNICLCCGNDKNITIDHVIPVSNGGLNDISNYQPLCRSCNSRKGTNTKDYR